MKYPKTKQGHVKVITRKTEVLKDRLTTSNLIEFVDRIDRSRGTLYYNDLREIFDKVLGE